jgi:light-regulated signal transduction histidine kinase (bacteriophytochrome)
MSVSPDNADLVRELEARVERCTAALAAAQMDRLIEALLDFYRTTRTELCLGKVDLETLHDETLVLCHAELKDRRIEWRRGALPRVRGDKVLLRQVFVNLWRGQATPRSSRKSPKILAV